MSQTQNPVSEIYAVFVGNIDQANAGKIVNGLTSAATAGCKKLHLMFQSFGGFVGDGVFLYNYFRSQPIEVILYNGGNVYSIATIAYLGAKTRKVSAHASFMIHRSHVTPQRANADSLQAITDSLSIDDARTEAILRAHLKLSDEQWRVHQFGDLYIGAQDAVKCGIADEVAEFSPPVGEKIWQIT